MTKLTVIVFACLVFIASLHFGKSLHFIHLFIHFSFSHSHTELRTVSYYTASKVMFLL